MPEFSPAAQSIEDAYFNADGFGYRNALAAALRAAADHLTPYTVSEMEGAAFARNKLLDIASEIEHHA